MRPNLVLVDASVAVHPPVSRTQKMFLFLCGAQGTCCGALMPLLLPWLLDLCCLCVACDNSGSAQIKDSKAAAE